MTWKSDMPNFEADGILLCLHINWLIVFQGIGFWKKILTYIAFNWSCYKGLSYIGSFLVHQDPSQHHNFSNTPLTANVFLINCILCQIVLFDSRYFLFNMITIGWWENTLDALLHFNHQRITLQATLSKLPDLYWCRKDN